MDLLPTPAQLSSAAVNVIDRVMRGGLADLRPLPAAIVDEGPQRIVRRFMPLHAHSAPAQPSAENPPVLLIPPLAAPALCFDLRRGCSLAEHLLAGGHPTYGLDYGPISFGDRDLGIEHWVDDVIPNAVRAVSQDAGGAPVQLIGWCLGGIMALLSVAAARGRAALQVRSIATIASPWDVRQVPIVAPLRPLVNLTGGPFGTLVYHLLGGAPAPLVRRVYQLAGVDKYLLKPLMLATNLDDREFLAQIEAVDRFMDNMLAYPGRTFGQLYHQVLGRNELADGRIALREGGRPISLERVELPVLSIAGEGDGIAPRKAVHHVARLLPRAQVRLETAPGGHLGVLTGRAARRTTWPLLDEFLAATSSSDDGAGRRGRRLRAAA